MLPILMIPCAFLVGSIPFSFLIGRANGVDIREHGSGNPGATNLGRALGRRFFFIGFALDMLKGLMPTLLGGFLLGTLGTMRIAPGDAWLWLAIMAAPVLGHMYTPWLGFKGGKGVATGLGAMLGVVPAMTIAAVGALMVFSISLALWRMVGVSSSLAAATLPVWVHLAFSNYEKLNERLISSQPAYRETPAAEIDLMVPNFATPFFLTSVALALLVVYKHRANLGRALRGQEPKVGERRAESAGAEAGPPVS